MDINTKETAFTIDNSSIKFGSGVTREVGYEMKRLGARKVVVITDPKLADSEPVQNTIKSLRSERIDTTLFNGVLIEPIISNRLNHKPK